jgi:hypothetical protein
VEVKLEGVQGKGKGLTKEKRGWGGGRTHNVEGESCKDVLVDFKGMRVFPSHNQLR